MNDEWRQGDGGELVIHPGAEGEKVVDPIQDRLVVFWSDSTHHEVRPTHMDAAERLALSFWYMKEPPQTA